jgi:serine/threonine protein kinase
VARNTHDAQLADIVWLPRQKLSWNCQAALNSAGRNTRWHCPETSTIGIIEAHDAQIGRDVAIKVSAQQFTDRFEREARAIGALNHPNICTLYDVGPNYMVMELVEGPTLAERIKEGPIPLEEALARMASPSLAAFISRRICHATVTQSAA